MSFESLCSYSDNIDESAVSSVALTNSSDSFDHLFDAYFSRSHDTNTITTHNASIEDVINDIKSYSLSDYHLHNFIINHCKLGIMCHVLNKYNWKKDEFKALICGMPALENAYNNNDLSDLLLHIDMLPKHLSRHLKYSLLRVADNAGHLLDDLRECVPDLRELIIDIYNDPSIRLNFPVKFRQESLDRVVANMKLTDTQLIYESVFM